MNCIKDKTSARCKCLQALANFLSNLVRCPKRQSPLGIYAAAPKSEAFTEFLLEFARVHARSRTLHWVQDVKTCVDEIRDQSPNRPAGVKEGLPRRMLMNPVVDLDVEGFVQAAICLGGNEGSIRDPKSFPVTKTAATLFPTTS